jgi:hypothetical protein
VIFRAVEDAWRAVVFLADRGDSAATTREIAEATKVRNAPFARRPSANFPGNADYAPAALPVSRTAPGSITASVASRALFPQIFTRPD